MNKIKRKRMKRSKFFGMWAIFFVLMEAILLVKYIDNEIILFAYIMTCAIAMVIFSCEHKIREELKEMEERLKNEDKDDIQRVK